jgi:predicted nucleic-acid-binding Zn-ribbon protein
MFGWLTRRFRKELDVEAEHGPVIVQGRQLRCNVCGNDSFWAKQVQLHTSMMTFLDLEAWNRVADCAICERCGHIHWFATPLGAEESGTETTDKAGAAPSADSPPRPVG